MLSKTRLPYPGMKPRKPNPSILSLTLTSSLLQTLDKSPLESSRHARWTEALFTAENVASEVTHSLPRPRSMRPTLGSRTVCPQLTVQPQGHWGALRDVWKPHSSGLKNQKQKKGGFVVVPLDFQRTWVECPYGSDLGNIHKKPQSQTVVAPEDEIHQLTGTPQKRYQS